ncbi:unnamed protein product [Discosporangium mesarthrocarpum]
MAGPIKGRRSPLLSPRGIARLLLLGNLKSASFALKGGCGVGTVPQAVAWQCSTMVMFNSRLHRRQRWVEGDNTSEVVWGGRWRECRSLGANHEGVRWGSNVQSAATKDPRVGVVSDRKKARRPPGYWNKKHNIELEIKEFWEKLGVISNKVPNETLLQFFCMSGLRHAARKTGGSEGLALWIGSEAIPGRWADAVSTMEVTTLFENGTLDSDVTGPKKGATPLLMSRRKSWPSQIALERGYRAQGPCRGKLKEHKLRKNRGQVDVAVAREALYEFCESYQSGREEPARGVDAPSQRHDQGWLP